MFGSMLMGTYDGLAGVLKGLWSQAYGYLKSAAPGDTHATLDAANGLVGKAFDSVREYVAPYSWLADWAAAASVWWAVWYAIGVFGYYMPDFGGVNLFSNYLHFFGVGAVVGVLGHLFWHSKA